MMSKELSTVNPINELSTYLKTDAKELTEVLKKTAFKNCLKDEDFKACVMVANTYKLNPILKQIYAFPAKAGGIVPVVSVDGWISIVTGNRNYNGVEFVDIRENGKLVAITCKIYIKGQEQPTAVTEYLSECADNTKDTWKKWPYRMLRHKAYIQCARMAFGFSGIYDEDEAQRIDSVTEETPTGKPDVEMPKAKKEAKPEQKKEETKAEVVDAEVVEEKPKEIKTDVKVAPVSMLTTTDNGAKIMVKGFIKDFFLKKTKTNKDFTQIIAIDSYENTSSKAITINCWGKKELIKGMEYRFDVMVKILSNGARNYLAENIVELTNE